MRLHRFYIEGTDLNDHFERSMPFVLSDKNIIHQLRSVFRLKPGHEAIFFDGKGNDFRAVILERENHLSRSKDMFLEIKEKIKKNREASIEVVLFQSLVKKDKFEWIAEKVTELGVSKIVPVISERSEKKAVNLERLKKILIEATEQSDREKLPSICGAVSFEEMLLQAEGTLIAFHPEGKPFHSFSEKISNKAGKPLSICIGPEGGWSESELHLFKESRAEIFSLGPMTLRAETAAISACALLLL